MDERNIYLTGDTHGRFLRIKNWCEEKKTKKEDVLIILGDAGINFLGGEWDAGLKRLLSTLPITLFCIHGNHEIRPQNIDTYQEVSWRGGVVYREEAYPDLLFAKDGEIYDLNGKKTLVIGGAYSVDKGMRTEGVDWWPDEQPSMAIKDRVYEQLERAGWKVDVVLTHTAPLYFEPVDTFLSGIDQASVDKTTETWLQSIENQLDYKIWYCGHYHIVRTRKTLKGEIRFMFADYDTL